MPAYCHFQSPEGQDGEVALPSKAHLESELPRAKPHFSGLLVRQTTNFPPTAHPQFPNKKWFGCSKPFATPATHPLPREGVHFSLRSHEEAQGCQYEVLSPHPPNLSSHFFLSEVLSTNTKALIFKLIEVENASYSDDS